MFCLQTAQTSHGEMSMHARKEIHSNEDLASRIPEPSQEMTLQVKKDAVLLSLSSRRKSCIHQPRYTMTKVNQSHPKPSVNSTMMAGVIFS